MKFLDQLLYSYWTNNSVFNFLFLPLIYFFYPETQNLSLEQIDKLFTGEKVLLHWQSSMGEKGAVLGAVGWDAEVKAGTQEHVESQVPQ